MSKKLSQAEHNQFAAEVRLLGPAIFARLIAIKNQSPIMPFHDSIFLFHSFEKPFNRATVVEIRDVERALTSPSFDAREKAVLAYIRDNFRRIGERMGYSHSVGYRHAISTPIRVVHEGQLDNFTALTVEPTLFADGFIAGLKRLLQPSY